MNLRKGLLDTPFANLERRTIVQRIHLLKYWGEVLYTDSKHNMQTGLILQRWAGVSLSECLRTDTVELDPSCIWGPLDSSNLIDIQRFSL